MCSYQIATYIDGVNVHRNEVNAGIKHLIGILYTTYTAKKAVSLALGERCCSDICFIIMLLNKVNQSISQSVSQ